MDGQYSQEATVDCAVPQGSILGPQEYSSYTIPLGSLIRMLALWFHFFADDSQLWKTGSRSVPDQLCSIRTIEHSIKSVAEWMFYDKLQLIEDKSDIASKRNHKAFVWINSTSGGYIIHA